MSVASLDRATTELQERGEFRIVGMSWASVYIVLERLGIDPARTIVTGDRLVYLDKRERPPP